MKQNNIFKTLLLLLCLVAGVNVSWASDWKDIAIDLRSGQLGTTGSNMSKYVTVGDTYTYADEEPTSYNALLSASSYNGSQHGYVSFKAKVPVEAGIYKITLGTCQYGSGTGYVKNADESSELTIVDENGQEQNSFNQNSGACYDANTTENIVSVWYEATSDQTITVVCGNYTPYFAIKKVTSLPGATGPAWANFADFSAIINNETGTLLTTEEMAAQGNAVSFGVVDNNGVTERVAADNEDAIAVITGKYHSEHGCTNVSVVVPVPGPVKIGVGECTYGTNEIRVKEGSTTVVSKTPATVCWKNDHFNVTYLYYTGAATTLTITNMKYCPFISVASAPLYTITGTISGGNIDGTNVILTSQLTGQEFSATVASNGFTVDVPADTYDVTLSSTENYVISSPTEVTVTAAAPLTINVISSAPQTVSGDIANAPTTDFTLTFTGTGANVVNLNCLANATSFTTSLTPDTYTMSSSVGTLSTLSQESFTVVSSAVTHNIYFPEAAVPAATLAEITVDNTAAVSANVYNTLTDALAAAKAGNISSPIITLTSGQTYMEQVVVDIPNVTLKTSGTEKATITWYYGIGYSYYSLNSSGYYDKDRAMTRNSKLHVNPNRWGATVLVKSTGTGFKAENIIFENSFNQYYTTEEVADGVEYNQIEATITYDRTLTSGQSGYKAADSKDVTERAAAIAFENNPTGVELYNCVFRGSQDTFYSSGKIHVKNCNIIGNTDYIFGGGYVVFDDCDLTIGGYSDQESTGYITASNGGTYIFRDCTVKTLATPRAHYAANLGRDWGGEAASVYYFNLKNEIGNNLEYKWTNMGGAVSAGTANLHIYDFDPTVNANYSTTGSTGANVNGLVNDDDAFTLYTGVVGRLAFKPEHILCDYVLSDTKPFIKVADTNTNAGIVTLNRNITAGNWSTIVLPFDLTSSEIATLFGAGTSVAELASGDASTLNFTTTLTDSKMKANQPYAIKVASDFTTGNLSGVTINGDTPTQSLTNWNFVGTYSSTTIPTGSYYFKSNKLYQAGSTGTHSIKPFRAYFTYTGVSSAPSITFSVDGETTGIKTIDNSQFTIDNVYNVAGQRVAQPTKGLYIVNGKKVIK